VQNLPIFLAADSIKLQRKLLQSVALALLVTLEKHDAARFFLARQVHNGYFMHSEIILVKNCLKRGLGNVCAYPDPETEQQHDRAAAPGMSAHYADQSIIC
jgi:hypothetical protein